MLRLTVRSQTPQERVVAVDGWVVGEEVAFLEDQLSGWVRDGRHLELILDGVRDIDRDGRALLRDWMERGVVLSGGSPFVRMLLKSERSG